jgi:hypothetical protein
MKDLDFDKPNEHIDYKLVPAVSETGEQEWHTMLLRAPFDGNTIRFQNVSYDGESQTLSFNFEVVDGDLDETNVELQEFATDVLQDILVAAINDGALKTKDSNGNQSGTDDSTESTD